MIDAAIHEISTIWDPIYTINEKDKTFLRKPVRDKFIGFNYGVYCGPFTNPIYGKGYEDNEPFGDPIDGLDFLCYLHDKFYIFPEADDFLVRSIDVLTKYNMISPKFNAKSILQKLFSLWRVLH